MPMILRRINTSIKLYCDALSDDSSTSSTIAVETPSSQKRVRFSGAPCQYFENSTTCQEDIKVSCWLGPNDYKHFRAAALEASQQIIQVEAHNNAPFSYQRILEHTYDACISSSDDCNGQRSVISPKELVHLQRWFAVSTSRMGLEKWSIRKISVDKSSRRKALNRVIADYGVCNSRDINQQLDHAEYLRQSCEALS